MRMMMKTSPGGWEWGSLFLVAAALAGCGDGATGPGDELRIDDISPLPFGPGDTVEVRGPSVGSASLALDGAVLEPVERGPGFLRFEAPGTAPCGDPLPPGRLILSVGATSVEEEVPRYARALPVDLAPGEHALLPSTAVGCGVELLRAGTYGVAAVRVAPTPPSLEERRGRAPFVARLRGGGAPAVFPAPAAEIGPGPRHLRPYDVLPPPPSGASEQCRKEPLPVGERIPLTGPYTDEVNTYEVVSASEHFAVLVRLDSLPRYSDDRRAAASGLAAALEEQVLPFLDRVFASWPDVDGDGRLNVLFGGEVSASYSGARGIYTDGCEGDFVRLAHRYLDVPFDAFYESPLSTVVHEAMHWYDIGPDLARQTGFQDWSIEGVASLAELLWEWDDHGRDPWANDGLWCPPDSTCTRRFLQDGRLGWPGLSREGGYSHGMYLTLYLVQQAVPQGASLLPALGRLRERAVDVPDVPGGPRSPVALLPLFTAAGGEGRTEAELQSGYLLSYWADDFVAGIPRGLEQPAWDFTEGGPLHPLHAFRLDDAHPEEAFALSLPDGVVFQVEARDGGTLFLSPVDADVRLAVVRGR